jgi:hypothetical protein
MAVPTNVTTGSKDAIGSTALQLTTLAIEPHRGVLVKADTDNDEIVYVGQGSGITPGTDYYTDGFPLGANEGVVVPTLNVDNLYVVCSGAGQKVFFMLV